MFNIELRCDFCEFEIFVKTYRDISHFLHTSSNNPHSDVVPLKKSEEAYFYQAHFTGKNWGARMIFYLYPAKKWGARAPGPLGDYIPNPHIFENKEIGQNYAKL